MAELKEELVASCRLQAASRKLVTCSLFLVTTCCLILFSGCFLQDKQLLKQQAKIQTQEDPSSWNFGRVQEGQILKHAFVLKNAAQKTLNIKDVNTSCGCMASAVAKKELTPGEETSIEVSFNSAGYSGAVQQFVYVHTDDPDNPVIRYIIKADVVK